MTHQSKYAVGITAYTKGKCRCDDCREAWRTYRREYERDKAAGRARTIDVAETREHVRYLCRRGFTPHSIAHAAGCDHQLVAKIVDGEHRRIRPATANRILSVTLSDLPDTAMRQARHARKLLLALNDAGLQQQEVAAKVRVSAPHRLAHQQQVQPTTWLRLVTACKLLAREGLVPASVLEEVGAV